MGGKVEAPCEIELKLALSEQSARALADHPLLRSADGTKPVRRHQVTAYFDTADGALARQGVSLRIRAAGGRHVQTLKTAASGGGIAADRGEWEWDVANATTPDLGLVAQSAAAAVAVAGCG